MTSSESSMSRALSIRLPRSRDVVPEARRVVARWLRKAWGSGGLPPGPAESRRRAAAARSDAAFGPAPATSPARQGLKFALSVCGRPQVGQRGGEIAARPPAQVAADAADVGLLPGNVRRSRL